MYGSIVWKFGTDNDYSMKNKLISRQRKHV